MIFSTKQSCTFSGLGDLGFGEIGGHPGPPTPFGSLDSLAPAVFLTASQVLLFFCRAYCFFVARSHSKSCRAPYCYRNSVWLSVCPSIYLFFFFFFSGKHQVRIAKRRHQSPEWTILCHIASYMERLLDFISRPYSLCPRRPNARALLTNYYAVRQCGRLS